MVQLEANSFHGMPWFQHNGSGFFRDNCVRSEPPDTIETLPDPVGLFPARNAPMDLAFIPIDSAHPWAGDAIVALHGSWATSDAPRGAGSPETRRRPGLVRVDFENGRAVGIAGVLEGVQLDNGARWARPVGVAIAPDGHIYFTSDGGIQGLYRLKRTGS